MAGRTADELRDTGVAPASVRKLKGKNVDFWTGSLLSKAVRIEIVGKNATARRGHAARARPTAEPLLRVKIGGAKRGKIDAGLINRRVSLSRTLGGLIAVWSDGEGIHSAGRPTGAKKWTKPVLISPKKPA